PHSPHRSPACTGRLIDRRIEVEILPDAEREGIGMIVYSPMAHGLLSGAMTRERIAALPADDGKRGAVWVSRRVPSERLAHPPPGAPSRRNPRTQRTTVGPKG